MFCLGEHKSEHQTGGGRQQPSEAERRERECVRERGKRAERQGGAHALHRGAGDRERPDRALFRGEGGERERDEHDGDRINGVQDRRGQADDAGKAVRKSHENPAIQELYKDFFGEPGSHLAHEVLHTHYRERSRF